MRRRTYWHPKMTLRILGKQDGRLAFSVISVDENGIWVSEDLADGATLLVSARRGAAPTHMLTVASFLPGSYRTLAEARSRRLRRNQRATHTGILTCHSFCSI